MTLKDFLRLYDNWNGYTRINDDNLKCIVEDTTYIIYRDYCECKSDINLGAMQVIAFGFYDNTLCIKVRQTAM